MVNSSPFHTGEQELQDRVGKREQVEQMGQKFIRSYMPEQHRSFYQDLPFILVGSVDKQGWPWASIVCGPSGFLRSASPTTLSIGRHIFDTDPLASNLQLGAPLGLLGIELHSRRRNRLNARISQLNASYIELQVDQSFGNCPQYIQRRQWHTVKDQADVSVAKTEHFSSLPRYAKSLIEQADTFFVSSYAHTQDNPQIEGVDVSHRGGNPGFVKIDGNSLLIPDFSGNNHFNTLGNFLLNPKAGLLFVDFTTGDLLFLTGTVEILWQSQEHIQGFEGAQRAWRFHLHQGLKLSQALPYRFNFIDYSPGTLNTGSWQPTTQGKQWQHFTLVNTKDESANIRSFMFKPTHGADIQPYLAGQHISIRVDISGKKLIRQYSLTSNTDKHDYYQISVKYEHAGEVSQFLHTELEVGDQVELTTAKGTFSLKQDSKRPLLLIGAGVGITPIYAMAEALVRQTSHRQVSIWQSNSRIKERAFYDEFKQMAYRFNNFDYKSFISRPETRAISHERHGRITSQDYQQLNITDYDIYLCGPENFMQYQSQLLRELGVEDSHIFDEAFGPAKIKARRSEQTAVSAKVQFKASDIHAEWVTGQGSLLEFAEQQGLRPEYSCRNGSCGSCKVKLHSGSVTYIHPPTAEVEAQQVLLCCSAPAKNTTSLIIEL